MKKIYKVVLLCSAIVLAQGNQHPTDEQNKEKKQTGRGQKKPRIFVLKVTERTKDAGEGASAIKSTGGKKRKLVMIYNRNPDEKVMKLLCHKLHKWFFIMYFEYLCISYILLSFAIDLDDRFAEFLTWLGTMMMIIKHLYY